MNILLEGLRLPFARVVGAMTAAAALFPPLYYAWARVSGALPSAEAWYAQGMNHGPWRWELPGLLLIYPFLLIIPATLLGCLILGVTRRDTRYLAAAAILLPIQFSWYVVMVLCLYWTVD